MRKNAVVLVERKQWAAQLRDTFARIFFVVSARHNLNPIWDQRSPTKAPRDDRAPVSGKPAALRAGELLNAEGCLETWARRRLHR